MVEYGSLESQRNDLAHGCFGICPDDEALLFMIKVENHVVWMADVLPKLDSGAVVPDPHQGLREKLWVYRLADFERLHSHMTRLWWNMFHSMAICEIRKTLGASQNFGCYYPHLIFSNISLLCSEIGREVITDHVAATDVRACP